MCCWLVTKSWKSSRQVRHLFISWKFLSKMFLILVVLTFQNFIVCHRMNNKALLNNVQYIHILSKPSLSHRVTLAPVPHEIHDIIKL